MKLGYARESTNKRSQDQPLEWHMEKLKRYGCEKIFVDRASGASKNRPGYNELLSMVSAGTATEVVVTNLKRFGRSVPEIYRGIDIILSKNVKFTLLDGSLDLSTAIGRANFGLQAVSAQMERELIIERINAGYDWVRANKYPIHAPFGYKIVDRQLLINVDVLEIALWIRQSVIDVGLIKTTQAINTQHPDLPKVPRSPTGLKSWLLCPTIYGHLRYGNRLKDPIVYYDNHPAIFTEEEKLEVLESLKFRQRHHGFKSDPVRFPFSGLIFCAECGASMQVSYNHDRPNPSVYYRCYNAIRKSCSNNGYTSVKKIEKALFQAIWQKSKEISSRAIETRTSAVKDPRLLELRAQLDALEKMPVNPHIEAAKAGIRSDIAIIEMESKVNAVDLNPERIKMLELVLLPGFWEEISPSNRQKTYRLLIKRIVCNRREVEQVDLWV